MKNDEIQSDNRIEELKLKFEKIQVIISAVSLIFSFIALIVSLNSNNRNKLLTKPHFSLEKRTEVNGDKILLLSNSGGMFYNSAAEAKVYLIFQCNSEDNDFDYVIELSDYIKSVEYVSDVASGAFKITMGSDDIINQLIEKIEEAEYEDGINVSYTDTKWYFSLKYNDYKEHSSEHKFTTFSGFGFDDSVSTYEGSVTDILVEVDEKPKEDCSMSLFNSDYYFQEMINSINYYNKHANKE